MSTTLVIASRELREKSRLLLVCAAAAVMPFLAALLPASRGSRPTVISVVSGFLAIAFCIGTAIAQGSSTIGRELTDRRLSFYFSKPVSPAAIWIGKAVSSLLISLASFAIITLPAYLAASSEWETTWTMRGFSVPMVALGLALVLFLLSHAVGSMIRSRSALIGLDFLLAAAAIGAALLILRPVILGMAIGISRGITLTFGLALIAILAAAPVYQLAKGRTDVRRSHAALSQFLWTAVAAVLLVAGAYVLWLVSLTPSSITRVVEFEQSQGGDWMFVTGTSSSRGDYHGSFLINRSTGSSQKVAAPAGWVAQISRNGKIAAWVEPASFIPRADRMEIFTRRLDVPGAKSVSTNIRGPVSAGFILSDDGSRIAVYHGRTVAVHDTATGNLVASAPLDPASRWRMFFVSADALRLIGTSYADRTQGRLRIHELDIPRKAVAKLADVEMPHPGYIAASADGSRLLLQRTNLVLDGRTGATVMTLPGPAGVWTSAVLQDGRAVTVTSGPGGARLRYIDPSGQPAGEIVLPTKHARIAAELTDGKLVLLGNDNVMGSPDGRGRTMFVVDGKSIVTTVKNVRGPAATWSFDPRIRRFDASHNLAGVDAEGRLVTWNPKTGETKKPG